MARYSDKQKAALDTLMKEDVFAQTVKLIADEGLSGLTMERLARGVGVSRATLYNYFKDRDALVEFVEDRTFAPLFESLERIAIGDLPPTEKLRTMAEEIFRGVFENRALVVALTPEKHRTSSHECQGARRRRARESVERVLREGVEGGEFRSLPVDATAELFLSAIVGLIDTMVFEAEFRKAEAIVPNLMDVFLGGLTR